ncbi:hypothetical protein [Oceanobacillus bengalensis]|uniref:Uncharacterized protein n=2 Tax=Oceanobacillus bengalensis TaxID=1435466 RepID=A0A494YUL0_9BACI|nr:hypothetical protein [Oceanobacillus bengalensis]RKQ13787.1 hypothetical protein D8M05_14865 [Oceanobacillus bengalensis]
MIEVLNSLSCKIAEENAASRASIQIDGEQTASVEEVAGASGHLAELEQKLHEIVKRFKL